MDLLGKILLHPANQKLLEHLDLLNKPGLRHKNGEDAGSGFDEGSKTLFYEYAADLPVETYNTISQYNMLINPQTGEIFAFQFGRFTFLFRCDFSQSYLQNTDEVRQGITLDDHVDFRFLGENWALLNRIDEGDEKEQVEFSYAMTK